MELKQSCLRIVLTSLTICSANQAIASQVQGPSNQAEQETLQRARLDEEAQRLIKELSVSSPSLESINSAVKVYTRLGNDQFDSYWLNKNTRSMLSAAITKTLTQHLSSSNPRLEVLNAAKEFLHKNFFRSEFDPNLKEAYQKAADIHANIFLKQLSDPQNASEIFESAAAFLKDYYYDISWDISGGLSTYINTHFDPEANSWIKQLSEPNIDPEMLKSALIFHEQGKCSAGLATRLETILFKRLAQNWIEQLSPNCTVQQAKDAEKWYEANLWPISRDEKIADSLQKAIYGRLAIDWIQQLNAQPQPPNTSDEIEKLFFSMNNEISMKNTLYSAIRFYNDNLIRIPKDICDQLKGTVDNTLENMAQTYIKKLSANYYELHDIEKFYNEYSSPTYTVGKLPEKVKVKLENAMATARNKRKQIDSTQTIEPAHASASAQSNPAAPAKISTTLQQNSTAPTQQPFKTAHVDHAPLDASTTPTVLPAAPAQPSNIFVRAKSFFRMNPWVKYTAYTLGTVAVLFGGYRFGKYLNARKLVRSVGRWA